MLDFWWSSPQEITSIGYFSTSDDRTIRIRIFWGNWALDAVEANEVAEATEVNEAGEVYKAWKITTDSRWILALFLLGAVEAMWSQISFKWFDQA